MKSGSMSHSHSTHDQQSSIVIGTRSNSTIDSHSNDVNVSQSSNPDYSYNDLYFVTLLGRGWYFCKWHVF